MGLFLWVKYLPRLPSHAFPPPSDGIQVNFCKNPKCKNYDHPAKAKTTRGRVAAGQERQTDSYNVAGGGRNMPLSHCEECGEAHPWKAMSASHKSFPASNPFSQKMTVVVKISNVKITVCPCGPGSGTRSSEKLLREIQDTGAKPVVKRFPLALLPEGTNDQKRIDWYSCWPWTRHQSDVCAK